MLYLLLCYGLTMQDEQRYVGIWIMMSTGGFMCVQINGVLLKPEIPVITSTISTPS